MADYTIDELVACALSREIRGDDLVVIGAATPLAQVATLLARATHAPHSGSIYSGAVTPEPHDVALTTIQPERLGDLGNGFITHSEVLDQIQNGHITLQFFSPAQIDQYGNVNTSLIGDHARPSVRFPGGLGMADLLLLVGRVVFYRTTHTPRILVEKVDFITGAGHPEEGRWRRRVGVRGKGPVRVITNLAVMGFDEENGEMLLQSVHPGVTVEEVLENTGFALRRARRVGVTDPPTTSELSVLREQLDPLGVRRLEFREFRDETLARLGRLGATLGNEVR